MPNFKQLWNNHPTIAGEKNPCNTKGRPNFDDQCAIRVGVSLAKCGVKTSAIVGATHCWHHPKSAGHILRAEELANGLVRTVIPWLGARLEVSPKEFKKRLSGKSGIIFFKDYWRRSGENQRNPSGDHIDLWNGSRLTDWTTWLRIQLGVSWEGVWSDYGNAKEIWFWQIQ